MSGDVAAGGCLCGAVRYEVDRPLRDVVFCHCSLCRRSGTHVGAYASAPRAALRVVEDRGLASYVDEQRRRRSFCRTCGASLFWAAEGSEVISIAAGSLDPPTGLATAAHIHVASVGDYYTVPADAPWHAGGLASPVVGPPGE